MDEVVMLVARVEVAHFEKLKLYGKMGMLLSRTTKSKSESESRF